ncbi:conserved exported hypothetical protein [Thiomonas sp. X19]|uniref:bifunctional glycoside hydrolase 114/ polysaccharide deacetylase family protein n=1 Tax=Thiomonas sp. X19 TaxID=1050370 RepID=UPI000B748388|nr:endo alpha-1,4 polygalactosaminidase [Thiomonas sp. X19]SCC94664.1 conserved exported hypothetical protein [Thiomonas sp. X19]
MRRRQFLRTVLQSQAASALGPFAALGGATTWASVAQAKNPDAAANASPSQARSGLPAVALYYANAIPIDELRVFDWVVLDPHNALQQDPKIIQTLGPQTTVLAYVSVGEVDPGSDLDKRIPAVWTPVQNKAWKSRVIDQTQAGWPKVLRERIVQPLWAAGFRAFFLDTLDSYRLLGQDPGQRQQQVAALQATLHALISAFPGIQFILNRGFELIDAPIAHATMAVAAESVLQQWDPTGNTYSTVSQSDRGILLQRFAALKTQWQIPGIAIDYVPPEQRELARTTARRLLALGLIPWVTDPDLSSLGVGGVEVVPRRVLALHSCKEGNSPALVNESMHIYGAMPLEYHGLHVDYHYAGAPIPEKILTGRYAGVVVWLDHGIDGDGRLADFLNHAKAQGVPILIWGLSARPLLESLGCETGDGALQSPIRVTRSAGTQAAEIVPLIRQDDTFALKAPPSSRVWLQAQGSDGQVMQGAAVTPWGGYAIGAFGVMNLPGDFAARWSVDPMALVQAALRLGDDPMPDFTTRTGRRVLMSHFDGDGWVNGCQRPGSALAGQVLVEEFLTRYDIPILGSIIVDEVDHHGEYPATATEGQAWARKMFALPNIEVGSHTWSHPFNWIEAAKCHCRGQISKDYPYGNFLPFPGYAFSTHQEVIGARDYIEQKLAPPGKPCKALLWPGDCNPPNHAVALCDASGLLNVNGGGVTMRPQNPSLTAVWPLGVPKGKWFQVYAACSDEEDYTNNWKGPYFGFENVIETFEMTENPRRLKPVEIYFHPYIVTRDAGAVSLHKVFQWALSQPLHPVFETQWLRSVLDWRHAAVARRVDGHGWRLQSGAHLRQWRQPTQASRPCLGQSLGVAGWNEHAEFRYLHIAANRADVTTGGQDPDAIPRLVDANVDVTHLSVTDRHVAIGLAGYAQVQARLALPQGWSVKPTRGIHLAHDGATVVVTSEQRSVRIEMVRTV